MDRNEIITDISILVISTCIGFAIAMLWEGIASKILFVVIEVVTLLYIGLTHKNKIYVCTECETKYKLGLIPDMESPTMENGDKIIKCKKCKKKTIFRRV